jgi:hypothetical protein
MCWGKELIEKNELSLSEVSDIPTAAEVRRNRVTTSP